MKKLYALLVAVLFCSVGYSQRYHEMMQNPSQYNFYDVKKKAAKEFRAHEREEMRERRERAGEIFNSKTGKRREEKETPGYEVYKRWEAFMEPRVYPSGDLTLPSTSYVEAVAASQASSTNRSMPAGAWTHFGPATAPAGGNVGRVNFVRQDPTNTSTIWVGSPSGGLWKTTDGGSTWNTGTDNLSLIGVSDIAINPANTSIMYMATGDGDASDTYSVGVLKSTDGGVTWNTTGLTWAVNLGRVINRLLINPSNPNILIAACSNGIYRTTDAGVTWTQVLTGASMKDAEFKPGDPTVVYACGTRFYKSTNSGQNFTQVTAGLPASTAVDRLAVAVTAADPTYVYVVAGSAADDGFYGLYRSVDSGTNFTTRSTTPNLLGWSSTGNDAGGQAWFTLAIASSPTNKDEVVVGGVNIWRSTNGGTSWAINAHWTATGAPYVHADIHDLVYQNGTTLFSGCDGGIFRTSNNGTSWFDISSNLKIAQMYGFGQSTSNATITLSGWQDNGTNRSSGSTWAEVMGGDGMKAFIDWSNDLYMYGEQYNGDFNRSSDGGNNWTAITSGITETGPWVTHWMQDPVTAATLYAGFDNVWKSTNRGSTWTKISTFSTSGKVYSIAVAPSNPQVIYAAKSASIQKTTNGGTSWTNITGTLPVSSASITYVAVSPTNPNKVWVTFSGYSSANKVYHSTDGGTTWTNYTTGLPNLPVNCITYQKFTSNGLYVGTDAGVYYRDSTMSSWLAFNTGLPNVIVTQIEIHYGVGKVRASTYGRGLWESPVYTSGSSAPSAEFTSNRQTACIGSSIQFTDQSGFSPTSWSWTFTGGTPATSTAQNPTVVYNTAGTYTVSLTATNANGSNTKTKTGYITITGTQALPLTEGFQLAAFPPTNWYQYNPSASFTWARATNAGGFGTSTASTVYDNYNNDARGSRVALWTPKYDFSGIGTASLKFDVAYKQWNTQYSDSLAVYVSTDCGLTFTQVYFKGGSQLATGPMDSTQAFTPTAAQWRQETISLNSYAGQPNVMVAFENRPGYGQKLYVDNINITGTAPAIAPTPAFTANSTTVCSGTTVNFTDQSTGSPTSWSWSFPGGTPSTSNLQNPTVTYPTAGTYNVSLTATNSVGSNSTTSSNYITVNTLPVVTAGADTSFCAGSSTTICASGASTYTWTPATGLSSTNTACPTSAGMTTITYTVTGTAANSCKNTDQVIVTVKPLPTVNAGTDQSICAGSSASLLASGGTSYNWTPAGSLSNSTASNPSASPSSTTTYTVTGTGANGCRNNDNVIVTVNSIPVITASADVTICAGSNATLSATGGTNYTWSPATGLSSTTSSNPVSSATTTTTYTVTGTSSAGCRNSDQVIVNVNPLPTVTAGMDVSICIGSSITLSANGGNTYTWSPSSNLSSATVSNPVASPSSTTTYTVTGTASSGCRNTDMITVTVNQLPVLVSSPDTSMCAGNTIQLSVTGANTYSWNPSTGLNSNTSSTPLTTLNTTVTYTITGTSPAGCTSTDQLTVSVTQVPAPPVAVNDTFCTGEVAILNSTSSGINTWYTTPTGGSPIHTGYTYTPGPSVTTTYYVQSNVGNCSSSRTPVTAVVLNGPPQPAFTQNVNTLDANPVGPYTYQWYLNNVPISGADSTSYIITQSGNYAVEIVDSNGCINSSVPVFVTVTGVDSRTSKQSFDIYPNPNNGNFGIRINTIEKEVFVITITDALGQLILKESVTCERMLFKQFDLGLAAGVYTVTAQGNLKEAMVKKVIVD